MKRQSLVLLAVALVAAGAAGCFKDPVNSLRSGAALLSLDHQSLILKTGDSVAVVAELKDKFGDALPATSTTWTSLDPTVAVVRLDTTAVPGDYFSRGVIRAVTQTGGLTTVVVSSHGESDTVRVTVMPAGLAASTVSFAGVASSPDTFEIPALAGPPPVPAKFVAFTAPDTLIVTGTSVLHFDTATVSVHALSPAGVATGFVVAKSPTSIKVVFTVPAVGKVVVGNLLLVTGTASVGTIPIDSLVTDTLSVSRQRFKGTIGKASVGGFDSVSVGAASGTSFNSSSGVSFGAGAGILLRQTSSVITALSPVNDTGAITVTGLVVNADPSVGSVTFDSVKTNGDYGVAAATFPMSSITMSPNNGKLGDTVIVTAPSGLTFSTGSTPTTIILGNTDVATSDTAFNLSASSSSIKAFPKRGGANAVTVTNLVLGSLIVPTLTTTTGLAIDSVATDFPQGGTKATAKVTVIPASGVDTVYGSVNAATGEDFWTFTLTATHAIYGEIDWYGTGDPYGSSAPNIPSLTNDLDLVMCDVTMACNETDATDLFGYSAATATQPQSGTSSPQAAGQYWGGVIPFTPDGGRTVVYRLIIQLQ